MIDRFKFFSSVRQNIFGGKMLEKQVQGCNAILKEWEAQQLTDLRWLAYMLATTYHETAATMQPIEEYGKGKGRKYGKADSDTGLVYYGRGYVQLTWKENYATMGKLLGKPLVEAPELALKPEIATAILFKGMIKGLFTGKKLGDYFNARKEDWVNARRIINGIDKAELIASYAKKFFSALTN